MSRSVAASALTNIKAKGNSFPKFVKSNALRLIRKEMDYYLEKVEPWPYIAGKTQLPMEVDIRRKDEAEEILEELGFSVYNVYGRDLLYLSIPMYRKGEKKSQAQLLLYRFDQKLNKARKEIARKDCQEVIRKLEEGDFESIHEDGACEITVKVATNNLNIGYNEEYAEEVKKIMKQHNLATPKFYWGEWKFLMHDKE